MASGLKDAAAGLKVIDCDTHWCEPPDLWTSRAPAKFKDRVPHMKPVAGEGVHWFIEGEQDFGYALISVVDKAGDKHRGFSLDTFEEIHEGGWDAKARLKFMDEHGIWTHIMYPNAAGFSAAKFHNAFKDKELQRVCMQIYNDAAADLQRESGGRLMPQALLPVTDMDECMKEMRRCTEDLKLSGFAISDNLRPLGLPDYSKDYWAPFFEYANSNKIPLNFHIGGTVMDSAPALWPMYSERAPGQKGTMSGEWMALHSTMSDMTNAVTIANFLYSGLYDKYPQLKMVSVESGIGWIPFFLEILEYQYDEMIDPENRRMQRRPRDYWNDHWYAMWWFEKFGPMKALPEVGVKNVLFETDFPHPTCLYPKNQEHVNEVLAGWDDYTRRRILQDNAAELYGVPLGAAVKA